MQSKQTKSSRSIGAKVLIGVLIGLLAILQARLWVSEDGFSEVSRLGNQVELQRHENAQLAERNARLEAEVEDLRGGFAAVEERARSDLGLIGPDESFYVFAGDGGGDRVEAE
ncbi:MAG: cell division protein FtsB [Gammaproteobacteria bacterium]|nr:MAG: cell division protein FtsB [Gammaproteobacteria bacterium]